MPGHGRHPSCRARARSRGRRRRHGDRHRTPRRHARDHRGGQEPRRARSTTPPSKRRCSSDRWGVRSRSPCATSGRLAAMIRIRLYRDGARLPDTVDLEQARESSPRRTRSSGSTSPIRATTTSPRSGTCSACTRSPSRTCGTAASDPKVELFEGYAFVAIRPMRMPDGELEEGEVHALVGRRFLATLCYGARTRSIRSSSSVGGSASPTLFGEFPGGSAVYFLIDEAVDGYLSVDRGAGGPGRCARGRGDRRPRCRQTGPTPRSGSSG